MYLCKIKYDMEQQAKFKIVYTEEAINFLSSLPDKARAKVAYNIGKSMYVLAITFSRNWATPIYGNFAPYIMVWHIVCLLSGTPKPIPW